MEPPGDLAQTLHEEPLPRVVRLPEGRVVREVLSVCLLDLEQQPEQVARRRRRNDASAQEIEDVSDVGEVETLMQERRIRVLQREATRDQLGGCGSLRRAAASGRCHHCAPRVSAIKAATTPPVCQKIAGVGAPPASNDLNSVMALVP